MVSSRTATALTGLATSLAVSLLLWWYFETLLVFLVVPVVPFLFRAGTERERPPVRECPECGFRTTEAAVEYCPRDGRRLR